MKQELVFWSCSGWTWNQNLEVGTGSLRCFPNHAILRFYKYLQKNELKSVLFVILCLPHVTTAQKEAVSPHPVCSEVIFFSPLKFSIDHEFSLTALDCYCHSRNTNSRCLRTTVQLYSNKKQILFAHLKYHESATRFISALIGQIGKWEAVAGVCLLSPWRRDGVNMQWSFFGHQSMQDFDLEVCLPCGVFKESTGPQWAQMKSDLSAERKRKSIEWSTLILQNQPLRVSFYLCAGTCVMDAGSCLLDNHCVLFQTHSRKCLFTKWKPFQRGCCKSGWCLTQKEADTISFPM